MARLQALFCTFLLLLIAATIKVQADSPCTRRCPEECKKRKGAPLDCLSSCVKQCEVGEHDGKWIPENKPEDTPAEAAAKQNNEVQFISKDNKPEVLPDEPKSGNQVEGGSKSTAKAPQSSPKLEKKKGKSKSNKKKKQAKTEGNIEKEPKAI